MDRNGTEDENNGTMYSCHPQVNILTALLPRHFVRHAVVCPGSQNAPIVHNLAVSPQIECHAVTDERSAGFVALGLALGLSQPVAVCVTSGSALLNLLPAVAEAYYQQVALVVISADRPQEWIGQLDGQTLPQPSALGAMVRHAVNLPIVKGRDKSQRWYANRLINEALLAMTLHGMGPVHINVPLCEPLHEYTVKRLPNERMIVRTSRLSNADFRINNLGYDFVRAHRPLIIVGQLPPWRAKGLAPYLRRLKRRCIVMGECLSSELALDVPQLPLEIEPDLVVHLGNTVVSKALKQWLHSIKCPCWRVTPTGQVEDFTTHLVGIFEGYERSTLDYLCHLKPDEERDVAFLSQCRPRRRPATLPWSQALAVRQLEETSGDFHICYANSSAIRLGCLFAQKYRFANRGVNGIDGSLSTAVGIALAKPGEVTVCVTGDLSFFYDSNALWNTELPATMRVLLLNNGGGGIFARFSGLNHSPARKPYVMATHLTSARGICQSHGVDYMAAQTESQLCQGINFLLDPAAPGPRLLEVFTSIAEDHRAMQLLGEY